MKSDKQTILKNISSTLTKTAITRYLTILILGTGLVVASVPVKRASIVEDRLSATSELITDGEQNKALSDLIQIKPWARNYPSLSRKLDCQIIRCHVRRNDMHSAQDAATKMFAEEQIKEVPPTGIWAWLLKPVINWMNKSQSSDIPPHYAGFDFLENELADTGRFLQLTKVQRIRAALEGINTQLLEPQPKKPSPTATSFVPKDESTESVVTTSEPASTEPEPTPQKQDIIIQQHAPPVIDPNIQWGVITAPKASVYTKKGKHVGDMPAGSLIEVIDVVSTKAGDLAVSKIPDEKGNIDELVIKLSNLQLRPGGLKTARTDEVDLRVKRAKLLAKMEIRKKEVYDERKSRNPHYLKYQKAKQAHRDFWEKVQKLQTQRDSATGAKHVEYSDKLRMMKGEDIRLAQKYEAAKRKYKDWMDKNKGSNGEELNDPGMINLMEQLADIEQDLSKLM